MYIIPRSPNEIPDQYWNPLLKEEHKKVASQFVESGLLKTVGHTEDGYPIYQCTDKGRGKCKSYLEIEYDVIFCEMNSRQQSIIKETAKWVISAAGAGFIGNRADAILGKSVDPLLSQIVDTFKQILKHKITVTLSN